jgi:tetratricopeptide (TPR) repeat protein
LLLRNGQVESLESNVSTLLVRHPERGELWHLLGLAQSRQRKSGLEALTRAVALLPEDALALVNLGNELGRLGRPKEAIAHYQRALTLRPDLSEAQQNLGEALLASGAAEQAQRYFRQVLEQQPGNARAHYGLARVQVELGQVSEAEAGLRRAILVDAHLAEAHNSLGNLLRSQSRLNEALGAYRRALDISPELAEIHSNLAVALRLQGQGLQAQESCRRALELNPRLVAALITWAETEADQGQFAEAETLYRRALAITPDCPEAWAGLGRLRRMTPADAVWLETVQQLVAQPLPPSQESLLRYAIGKYLDDLGEYDAAFESYRRANALDRKLHAGYERGAMSRMVDDIIQRQNRTWLDAHRLSDQTSERAVLIVGMPRSGTSLAEQILAAHPAVLGAGELPYWAEAAARSGQARSPRELGSGYLHQLALCSAVAPRVVDKMPSNFLHLGLVHAALPAARVIHLQRDPVDTCLSIYFQHFEGFHTYANDLEDLAHLYGEYRRVMAHWRATLPAEVMLEVPYAALVAEPELWSRRMIEFIGLPWDPRCLAFYSLKRTVLTASQWQVRQQISGMSLDRWRHYRDFIGPLQSLWPEGRPPS